MNLGSWRSFFVKPWVVVFLIIVGFGLASYLLLGRVLSTDQGIAATIAQQILRGKLLYKDIWHLNTPGIHLTYVLGLMLLGQTILAVNLWHVIWQCLTIIIIFITGRQWFGTKAGLWSAFIYAALISITFSVLGSVGNKESFIILPLVLGLYFWKKANLVPGRALFSILTGLCIGWAWYYKPVYGIVLIVFLLALFIWHENQPRIIFKQTVLLGAGLILSLSPLVGYLAYHRLFYEAYQQMFLFAAGYGATTYKLLTQPQLYLFLIIHVLFFVVAILPIIFLFIMGTLIRDQNKSIKKDHLIMVALFGLLFLMVVVQMKPFFYQWQALLGPLVLITGLGIVTLKKRLFKKPPIFFNVILVVAVVVILLITLKNYVLPHGSDSPVNAQRASAVGKYLRNNVNCQPNQTVQIWGTWSVIYFLSGCRPATPFIYSQVFTAPTTGRVFTYQQTLKERFTAALIVNPSNYFVVIKADSLWGDPEVKTFPWFSDWLLGNYLLEKQIGDFYIYKQKE